MGNAELIVAAVSVLLGWYLGVRSERLSAAQNRLSASKFAADWFSDLREWASEAIDVLSEAVYHVPGRDGEAASDPQGALRCRQRLSALIDRGRFFLPNYAPDSKGADKPSAFRGHRHPALDYLVAAERVLAGAAAEISGAFPSERAALVGIKRGFVSRLQEILDPRSHNQAVADLVRAAHGPAAPPRSALDKLVAERLPAGEDDPEWQAIREKLDRAAG